MNPDIHNTFNLLPAINKNSSIQEIQAALEQYKALQGDLVALQDIARAPSDLNAFIRATFDGGIAWSQNWHHPILCGSLMRLRDPEDPLDRLIVTMPPRHSKSEICTRKFPAWCIGLDPYIQIIICAYGLKLAKHFSDSIRSTMESDAYKKIFPNRNIPAKSGSDMWYLYDPKYYKRGVHKKVHVPTVIAAGVGGPITGFGGKLLIIDDPIKTKAEAESLIIRESTWTWYTETFRTRVEPGAAILIVMTRWHEDDLVGRVINLASIDKKADQYAVLNLPAIKPSEEQEAAIRANLKNYVMGVDDPRLEGEALHEARMTAEDLVRQRATMGERGFQSLYQGNPTPPEGAMFKRGWFESVIDPEYLPEFRTRIRFWDWAVSEDGDAYSGLLLGLDPMKQRYIEDVKRGFSDWAATKKLIMATARTDGRSVTIGLEEVAKDVEILRELKVQLGREGFKVITVNPRKDKQLNSLYAQEISEAGLVTIVNGLWVPGFLSELCAFPFGTYDDQCDSFFNACNWTQGKKPKQKPVERDKGELPAFMDIEKVTDAVRRGHLKNFKAKKNKGDGLDTDITKILGR